MRLRFFIGLAFTLIIIAACQGPPPTQIILVVTATPMPGAQNVGVPSDGATPTEIVPTNEQQPTERPAHRTRTPEPPSHPTDTPPPAATDVPAGFPTPTFSQIQVAEQVFEHG